MEVKKIRLELFHIIMQADGEQLKGLKVLIINYLKTNPQKEEWDTMPQFLKDHISENLEQADAGSGTPILEVMERIRAKYGLG